MSDVKSRRLHRYIEKYKNDYQDKQTSSEPENTMSDRNEANIPIKKRSVKGITQFKNYEADTRKLQNKFDAIADENPTTSHGTPILDDEVKDKYSDVSCKLKRKVQTNDCYESNETCSSFENDNSPIHHSQTGSNDMQENILHSSPTANAKSNETVAGKKILKRNNDKKQFNCDFCQLSFDQQDDLNNHLLIHQNEVEVDSKNGICCHCQIPFRNMNIKEIENHIRSHITPTSTARLSKKRELTTCEHCSEKVPDLNRHIFKSIKVCSVCAIDIKCSSMMKLHQHNLHRSVFISRKFEMSDSEDFHLCLSCMEYIPNLNSLINHSLCKDHIGFNHEFNV